MPRLPIPGSDEGNWGRILNDYLLTTHAEDGTLKPGTITSASLSAGAITTTALADGIVSEAKLDATVRTKLNSTSGTSVAGLLGQPNGIATLDASGKVPASQLPTSSGGTTPDATANSKGSIQLTGDLGGSATSPRVMGLNGITVSGTPTPGQVLTASSSSTAAWSTNARTGGMLWTSSTAPTTQEGAADGDLWTDAATDPVHLRVRVNGQWVSLASVPKPSGGTINPAPGTPNGTPSDTSIILNWTAPANPGGTVSGYNVYDAQGTKLNSTPLTATSYTVTGLTAGTSYSFTIRSIVNGTEASQGATVSVTTTGGGGGTTVPTAPTNVTATAGDGQASVTFTPVSGATSYTVTASSGQTQTGTSSPITVTGLTNGTAVTFTVTASNSAGTSPASAASGAVTPEGGGGTPSNDVTGLTVTPAETSAVVSWVAPTNPTGSIEGYNVYQGSTKQNTSVVPTSPYTVTGLTADTDYTFTVKTVVAGAESTGVSVGGRTTGGGGTTVPTAPTNVTATAGDGQASVTFTPVSGATSYTVTASSGQTQTGTSSPITVTGLTNGTAVTFTVTASNSAGTSPASAASGAVTPEGGGGSNGWITRQNTQLYLNNAVWRGAGTNWHWMGIRESNLQYPSHAQIETVVNDCADMSFNVIRAHSSGISYGNSPLQLAQGVNADGSIVWNNDAWEPIDYAVSKMKERGIFLWALWTDMYYYYQGGKAWWVKQAFLHQAESQIPTTYSGNTVNYDNFNTSYSEDALHKEVCLQFYKNAWIRNAWINNYVVGWFNHVNQYTSTANKNEPTIAFAQGGNELWDAGTQYPDHANDAGVTWQAQFSAAVKGVSPNCLVIDSIGTDGQSNMYAPGRNDPNTDILDTHFYDPSSYTAEHVTEITNMATMINKPMAYGEYSFSHPGINTLMTAFENTPGACMDLWWAIYTLDEQHGHGGTDSAYQISGTNADKKPMFTDHARRMRGLV
jgi:hypothetical protein